MNKIGFCWLLLALTACGGGGSSGGSSGRANIPPVADAGAARTVNAGDSVTLDGSGSRDPDGSIVNWEWQQVQGPTVTLGDRSNPQLEFTAPEVTQADELVFTLTVRDGSGATASDSVAVTVEPVLVLPRFSITGKLSTSSNQALDSDVNDPAQTPVSNDTQDTAQPISNPVTLGGYVNLAGTGDPGRSMMSGDEDDFFQVELLAGQLITLLVADFDDADADLYLYDSAGEIVDFSIETGEIESLSIGESGSYRVNVTAFDGATNYLLVIGSPTNITADVKPAEIVPWQAVVDYRDNSRQRSGPDLSREDLAESVGMRRRAGGPGRGQLMQLRRLGLHPQQIQNRVRAASEKGNAIIDADLRARWETLLTIKSLRKDPRVKHAEPNFVLRAKGTPNDAAYPLQWHLPLIGLPSAWDLSTGSSNVVVAVVDSGILPNHPDLNGQLVPGYDFVRNPAFAGDGDGIDEDASDPGSGDISVASSFHGSHVSGTVAAAGENRIGVAGVAYGARVMPLRALAGDGVGTSYDVRQAIRYAAGLPNDSGLIPDAPADIINLSLGGGGFSAVDQALLEQVWQAGVLTIAAAGNEASTAPSYPAAYDFVLSVSAIDAQRRVTRYSNTGATIDLAAPGGDAGIDFNGDGYPDGVLSTGGITSGAQIDAAYTFLSGTSMAAPHVAGVMALMKSVNPDLTPADIVAMLERGELTDDEGSSGRDDNYGHGIVNARRAVVAALDASGTTPADNPRLRSSAATLSFPGSTTALELVLDNAGRGDLELLTISADQEWLSITAQDVDAQGLGRYRVEVDRTNLEPGVYAARITAVLSINTITVDILVTVGGQSSGSDIGIVYVLLLQPNSEEPLAQFNAAFDDGNYAFNFTELPQGNYSIVAGTDSDNDVFICDSGEACGAWLTLEQPALIELDEDREGLEFPVEFQVAIPSLQKKSTGKSTRNQIPLARPKAKLSSN